MGLEDSSTMMGLWITLRSHGFCVPWKPPQSGEGQFPAPRALMSPGLLSVAVGRPAVPVYIQGRDETQSKSVSC